MSNRELLRHFSAWRATGETLVLATVVETEGSTYSKAGRHLLINPEGRYAGLVGGGCLEGDLVLQAEHVRNTREPLLAAYDMRTDADDLWGLGLGCRGLMRLLLQPLDATNEWQPFTQLAELMAAATPTSVSLTIASDTGRHPVGALSTAGARRGNGAPTIVAHSTDAGSYTTLNWTIRPWPRLLVLGAGPDAAPVINFARSLGWETTAADHREAYLAADYLATADRRVRVTPTALEDAVDIGAFDAIIMMSHHLETDLAYARQVAQVPVHYVGVLGPAARRQEILDRLKLQDSEFAGRLHGPVGLPIGADTPQSIALALVAEIHATLHATEVDSPRANEDTA